MSTAVPPSQTMSAAELMALPEDGIRREIIRGQLLERPMTLRNRVHSEIEANVALLLGAWRSRLSEPKGRVACGEAGFRLRTDPETLVGIDVAYASAELITRTDPSSAFYDGPPTLAVEILSPSDRHEQIVERVRLYLEVGTVVWIVDPDFRTVTVYRPSARPEAFNESEELNADPYLPGFRESVAKFFG